MHRLVDSHGAPVYREWGVRELGAALKLPVGTVHGLLASLARHGMIQRDPVTGRYQVGSEL